jgi:hypothetical protein
MRAPAEDISLADAMRLAKIKDKDSCEDRWVKIDHLSKRPKALDELIQHAATGRPFMRTGIFPDVIVEASNSTSDEQHIALCFTQVIKDVAGPPEDCRTVAIITLKMTLLRIGPGNCPSKIEIRLDGNTIDIVFDVETQRDPSAFINPLIRLLNDDLKLSTELGTTKAKDGTIISFWLLSTSGLRDSTILQPGWRDTFNFDIAVSRDGKGVNVHGSTRPLVSRTASGQRHELNPPNADQRTTYAITLNKKIHDAIAQACSNVTEVDDKHLICE